MNWLSGFWASLTWTDIIISVIILVISFSISILIVSFVMVRLPSNYFHTQYEQRFLHDKHPVLRWSGFILKNIVGVIVILMGLVMAFPGVPGPGVLTILIGLIMVDIPGKRRAERFIVNRPTILSAVNDLRARYKKPPFLID